MIVIGYNNKANGSYVERLGVFYIEQGHKIALINVQRISYWLLKGGIRIKPKVSEIIGFLGQYEVASNKKVNDK